MSDCTTPKRIALISRSGPAFSVADFERAHRELDLMGVPRHVDGHELNLPWRIIWLRINLEASNDHQS